MSTTVTVCMASILLMAGGVFATDCGNFGEGKVGPGERKKCMYFTPPEELQRIRRGGYSEYVGMFINDGRAIWCGFDADTGEVIRVDRYAGRQLSAAPQVAEPTGDHFRRKIDKMIDVVTRKKLTGEELRGLICLSNELWKSSERNMDMATDVHNAVILLDGDQGKMFGGPGVLTGPADKFDTMLCRAIESAK